MFEKRPIWGIIVGLNVCVLIWLISVQEPVMYDANSAVIISGSIQQQQTGGVEDGGLIEGDEGEAVASVIGLSYNVPLAGNRLIRDNRDVKDKQQQQQQQQQQRPLYTRKHNSNNKNNNNNDVTSTLTTLNISSSNSKTNNFNRNNLNSATPKSKHSIASANVLAQTTTDAAAGSQATGDFVQHSLTSSLGTGLHDAKNVRPTPSWRKLTAVSSALPNEDFNHLIDLQHFHYLVPQPVCSTEIQALILVHSAPRNYEKRQIIRETWASIGRHAMESPLRVLFLLGAVASEELQQELHNENNEYADIVQGSFIDDYRNMTYKHVMGLKWFLYNCPEAQILIKVDDDVYVNTPQLIKYLKDETKKSSANSEENPTTNNITSTVTKSTKSNSNSNSLLETLGVFTQNTSGSGSASTSASQSSFSSLPAFNASQHLFHRPQNLLFCQKIIGALVKRSYRSKWRVGFKEFSERYYPPYCPGYAIIYSPDVIFRLYTAAQNANYFWIDDVHITGVLAQQTNTTITTSAHYVLYSDECERLLTGKTDLNDVEFLFAWHSIMTSQIRALWHLQMMSVQRDDDDDLVINRAQEVDNSISSLKASAAAARPLSVSSSSIYSSSSSANTLSNKAEHLSYNISNSITPDGFR